MDKAAVHPVNEHGDNMSDAIKAEIMVVWQSTPIPAQ
jgi:hypothetical protein